MELINNQYLIQNIPVQKIAQSYGTPLYIYNSDKIVNQYHRLCNAFAPLNIEVKYACKALTNISILKLLHQQGAGIDAVSIQELKLALHAGVPPEKILFTPNCVDFEEVQQAISLGVHINIDSISILEQFGQKYGSKVPCCIRINPHILAGGNANISTGHIDSKFGISILQMRHMLRLIESLQIKVIGIHVHTGSDILDLEAFLRGAEVVFEVAEHFKQLEFLDFGSGFKVSYRQGDIATDVEALGKRFVPIFQDFCKRYGRQLALWFEPGKFLVSEAGYLLVQGNVVKTTPATVFVGVNSGMNHLLRPMLYDAHHEIFNLSNPSGTKRIYNIVGYICETDTLGADRQLADVREGHILCIKNAGAYGFSMTSNYNSRLRPAEVLVHEGKAHLIRKREQFEDLLRHQVEFEF